MQLKLFDVSTCNAVDIQCAGIAYRYVTGMGSPSLRKEGRPLTFFMSICPNILHCISSVSIVAFMRCLL